MQQSFGFIVFVLIAAVVAAFLILVRRQRGRLLEALAELSTQSGWQFSKGPSVYVDCVLRGRTTGVPWELQFVNGRRPTGTSQADRTESIVWSSIMGASQDGTVLIYPKLSAGMPSIGNWSQAGALGGLMGELFTRILGAAGIDLSHTAPQPAGSAMFQEKYMVLAPDLPSAQRIVSAVEFQLLGWPDAHSPQNMPSVSVDASGAAVRVIRSSLSIDAQRRAAELMVPLGVAAATAGG